jgi:hypothetical protein
MRFFVPLFLLLLLGVSMAASKQKLYLTDGSHHVVREFQVKEDRVRFYSTERSQWEEIPLSLVDLEKTKAEIDEVQSERAEDKAFVEREEAAERRMRKQASLIPEQNGAYFWEGNKLREVPLAELKVKSNKGRAAASIVAPMISGKRIVLVEGEHSETVVTVSQPEFYVRLHRLQVLGFLKLEEDDDDRIVQTWNTYRGVDYIIEEQIDIEDFRREVGRKLYLIWPREPLPPGEYALATYAPGEGNIRIWDFRVVTEDAATK